MTAGVTVRPLWTVNKPVKVVLRAFEVPRRQVSKARTGEIGTLVELGTEVAHLPQSSRRPRTVRKIVCMIITEVRVAQIGD